MKGPQLSMNAHMARAFQKREKNLEIGMLYETLRDLDGSESGSAKAPNGLKKINEFIGMPEKKKKALLKGTLTNPSKILSDEKAKEEFFNYVCKWYHGYAVEKDNTWVEFDWMLVTPLGKIVTFRKGEDGPVHLTINYYEWDTPDYSVTYPHVPSSTFIRIGSEQFVATEVARKRWEYLVNLGFTRVDETLADKIKAIQSL